MEEGPIIGSSSLVSFLLSILSLNASPGINPPGPTTLGTSGPFTNLAASVAAP